MSCRVCGRYALKADVWSFGMTLMELAQGHAPFASLPFEVLVLSVVNGPTPGLEQDAEHPENHFSKVSPISEIKCRLESGFQMAGRALRYQRVLVVAPGHISRIYADARPN